MKFAVKTVHAVVGHDESQRERVITTCQRREHAERIAELLNLHGLGSGFGDEITVPNFAVTRGD